MAIKELLTLEGVEEVKKKLGEAAQAGEDFLKQVRDSSTQTGTPLNQLTQNLDKSGGAFERHRVAVERFRDSLHVLRPILSQLGVNLGELGSFSRVAGAGAIGLGAAVAGTLVVALLKLDESSVKSRQRLIDLFQSTSAGKAAFQALSDSAAKLGTTLPNLLPGFEGFVRAFNTFQQASKESKFVAIDPKDLPTGDINKLKTAFDALFAALRAGGATEDQAKQRISEFNAQMKATGQVTGEVADKLLNDAPGALRAFETALGRPLTTQEAFIADLNKTPIAFDKFVDGLARIQPETQKSFDSRPVRTFTENIGESFATIQRGATGASDSINQIGEGLDNTKTNTQEFAQAFGADIPAVFSDLTIGANDAFNRIQRAARTTFDIIKQIFSQPILIRGEVDAAIAGSGAASAGFAGGGQVFGPGTGTSDSILARLSRGEFVQPALRVQQYGVAFMEALRRGIIPADAVRSLMSGMRGFSVGGVVDGINKSLAIPRFAAGGLAISSSLNSPGSSKFTLVIGNEVFGNISASDDVAERLVRFGRKRNIASAGRAPSRVGSR